MSELNKIKKSSITLIILIFGINSIGFTQFISKGSILGNGSATYKSTKNGNSNLTIFSLLPWVGLFVTDNFVVGAGFSYESSSSNGTVNIYLNSTTTTPQILYFQSVTRGLTIGPVVRYYFDNGFFLHSQYSIGFQRFNKNGWYYVNPSDYNLSIFRGGLGYGFKISRRILLEPLAGYTSQLSTSRSTKVESHDRGYFFLVSFTMLLKSED